MANELTIKRDDLQALISSPELLALRRISLGTVSHPGMLPRTYLSGGLTLSTEDRSRINAKVREIRAVCEADDSQENQKARLGLIGSMLMAYPVAGSAESGRARAVAYLVALDDVPAWAISEAIRKWHRGECLERHNYSFAPAPAELRMIVLEVLRPAKHAISHLEAVLNAMTLDRAMNPEPVPKTEKPNLRLMP